jgi:uncharacterized protein (TIGR02594 family)
MLPKQYAWLEKEPAPRMLLEGLKLFGTKETIGKASNPVIVGWAKEVGGPVAHYYLDDAIPWCGLFMAVVAERAGWSLPLTPLWALSWAKWGEACPTAMLGDVLVYGRDGGGHVGMYVGEDKDCYHTLGGNQGDAVSIARIKKSRLVAHRRAPWRVGQPGNVRVIHLAATGAISANEA